MNPAEMEAHTRELGAVIGRALPPGVGFMVALFDFGYAGTMSYISNAERAAMIKMLDELRQKLIEGRQ